jgi:hypothetical protein
MVPVRRKELRENRGQITQGCGQSPVITQKVRRPPMNVKGQIFDCGRDYLAHK